MGLEFIDMDNKKEYTNYKKKKRHEKFMKENPHTENVQPSYEAPVEENPEMEITSTMLIGKVVKLDQLRVRNYPEGDVIKLINRGIEVEVVSEHDDIWYKVRLADGTVGYCMKEFLETYIDGESHGLNDPRRCKTWPIL